MTRPKLHKPRDRFRTHCGRPYGPEVPTRINDRPTCGACLNRISIEIDCVREMPEYRATVNFALYGASNPTIEAIYLAETRRLRLG